MPDDQTLAKQTRDRNANEADSVTGKTVELEIEEYVTEVVGASPVNDLTPNVPAPPSQVKQ